MNSTDKIKLITVCGPTASGKTALGVELAKRLYGEIVSADSMQIYKGMDIVSAKPDKNEMQGIKHHLIGFVDITENYSVARFIKDAQKCIADITKRGKFPIIVGGTGLYIDSLLNNLSLLENSYDKDIRTKLYKQADEEGVEKLYSDLCKIDPCSAKKIHPNNKVKIVRALEIYYSTGKTLTEQNEMSLKNDSVYDNTFICLTAKDRLFLYDRINRRVDDMMEKGLLSEAENFFENDYSKTAFQAIGYKELRPCIDGKADISECVEKLKQATRNYAKRQLTWFRRNENMNYFYIDEYDNLLSLCDDVLKFINERTM